MILPTIFRSEISILFYRGRQEEKSGCYANNTRITSLSVAYKQNVRGGFGLLNACLVTTRKIVRTRKTVTVYLYFAGARDHAQLCTCTNYIVRSK